jgi:hypothetical protein
MVDYWRAMEEGQWYKIIGVNRGGNASFLNKTVKVTAVHAPGDGDVPEIEFKTEDGRKHQVEFDDYIFRKFKLDPTKVPSLAYLAAQEYGKQEGPQLPGVDTAMQNAYRNPMKKGGRRRKHKTRKQKKRSRKTRRR